MSVHIPDTKFISGNLKTCPEHDINLGSHFMLACEL